MFLNTERRWACGINTENKLFVHGGWNSRGPLDDMLMLNLGMSTRNLRASFTFYGNNNYGQKIIFICSQWQRCRRINIYFIEISHRKIILHTIQTKIIHLKFCYRRLNEVGNASSIGRCSVSPPMAQFISNALAPTAVPLVRRLRWKLLQIIIGHSYIKLA